MTACIEHTQAGDRQAYGYKTVDGTVRLMHRLAYAKAHNLSLEDIHGKVVRHTCDNRRCVNPEHLLIGTHKDNMQDAIERGRFVVNLPPVKRGADHGMAKLTPVDVAAIRESRASRREIREKFGVSKSQVQRILTGASWT